MESSPVVSDLVRAREDGRERFDSVRDLVTALQRAAASDRGIVLVHSNDTEERRTYEALLVSAHRRAAALIDRGLQQGDRVVIVLNTSFEFVETYFGVLLAGGVPVPAYPPVAMARLSSYVELLGHIIEATSAPFLVTDAQIGGVIGTVRRTPGLRALLDVARLDAEPTGHVHYPSPDDMGLIQCTSGSTSAPKPVVLLHRNLLANIEGFNARWGMSHRDVMVTWLPLYHDLGLIGTLFGSIVACAELVMLSPSVFLLDAGAWWRAVDRHRGTITGAPNFAFGLSARRMGDEEIAALDLSSVKAVVSGAEPIQAATIAAFYERFAPARLSATTFCSAYGLAESCVGVTGVSPGTGVTEDRVCPVALHDAGHPRAIPSLAEDAISVVSVGAPFAGSGLVIRDADGNALPERSIGEVWVSGASIMAGYLGNAKATAEVLQGGELRTGDLGYVSGGELFVVGRKKHMLIVRGRNYYAEAIETVIESVEGVRKGNAVAYGVYCRRSGSDKLHVAVETRLRNDAARALLEDAIKEAVSDEVGIVPSRVLLLAPNTLPKTSSGKKQRLRAKELVESGALTARMGKTKNEIAGVVTLMQSRIANGVARLVAQAS
jgi:acyl-CoA synthetase (AMP-forming)/AMP-acid ligase II